MALTWNAAPQPVSAGFEATQDGNFITLVNTSRNADSLRWLLPDGTTTNDQNLTFKLGPGSSTISLVASNSCDQDTFSQTFLFSFTLEPESPEIFLYPNPARDQITFSTPRAFTTYRLYYTAGRIVAQNQFTARR